MTNFSSHNLPIIEQFPVSLDQTERVRIKHIARQLCQKDKNLNTIFPFGDLVSSGLELGPAIVLEDHSWIRLFEYTGDEAYSYRALLLAGEGDVVIIGISRSSEFEAYCEEKLLLGKVDLLYPSPTKPTDSLATRCIKDKKLIDTLATFATKNKSLNFIPYMSTNAVWALAQKIATITQISIFIAGPTPYLCCCVNNKLWFTKCAKEVLGIKSVPTTFEVHNLSMLCIYIAKLIESTTTVAIKLKDSASSAGNLVLDSNTLRTLSLHTLREHLLTILAQRCWNNSYPLMVSAWESPVAESPSVHLWIPKEDQGLPVVEGIFDQIVSGTACEFVGAVPSRLDDTWQNRIAKDAVRLGYLFQTLGYFGRCSLDAIIVGQNLSTATMHWVECNGRWGGVSIPITLANRLVGNWQTRPFVIMEESHLNLPYLNLSWIMHRLKDNLYSANKSKDGAVILSPGKIESGNGYELMVFGENVNDALAKAESIKKEIISIQ